MPGQPPSPLTRATLTRRAFLAASILTPTAILLYSNVHGRHELEITHRTFFLANLPPAFEGFRIVQISDIHLDEYTEAGFLERVLRHVNALAPDLVLLTGDFVSKGPRHHSVAIRAAGQCGELLRAIACPLRYAILGNHDVDVDGPAVADHLRTTGTPVLINQYVPIERAGQRIWIAGLDDAAKGHPDLSVAIPTKPDGPVILMAHEPDYADTIAAHPRGRSVNLVLSGHSHGGQVRLPFLLPLMLPPMGKIYYEGLYRLDRMQLYVNRGIGTVGVPFRFNCPPEITVATLKPVVRAEAPL